MKTCKNCKNELTGRYCSNCGQEDFDPPYNVKEFFSKDVKNEVVGFDRGFVYTVKKLLLKPGEAIYDFIQGKRVGFIPPFSFILVTLAFVELVNKYGDATQYYPVIDKNNFVSKFLNILVNDPKWNMILLIPIFSIISSKVFKKYNVAFGEHFLFNLYAFSTINVIQGLSQLPLIFHNSAGVYFTFNKIYMVLASLYFMVITFQYFTKESPSEKGTLVKTIINGVLCFVIMIVLYVFLAVLENLV